MRRLTLLALLTSAACRSASEPAPQATPILFTSSPNGQQEQLATISTDGRRLITPAALLNAGGGDWAPDGRRIVFARAVAGSSQIFVGRADGSMPPVQITQCPVNCYVPRWSPDGARIAYWSNYPPVAGAGGADSGVTVVADTTGANGREIAATRQRTLGYAGPPAAWAPDGRRFAYTHSDGSLFTVNIDGSPAAQIQTSMPVGNVAWSPDGARLAVFVSGGGLGLLDIAAAAPGAAPLVRLDEPNDDHDPAWSPDGRQLVFSNYTPAGGGNAFHLTIINTDGSGRVELTPGRRAFDYQPRWNPASPR